MRITRFEDIDAWKKARALSKNVYEATRDPKFRIDPDLQRQLRRAAVSTMANIAEGFDSGSDPEFRRFLRIAARSASEIQSHLYVAFDQGYLTTDRIETLRAGATEVRNLVLAFIRYLRRPRPGTSDLGPGTVKKNAAGSTGVGPAASREGGKGQN